MTAGLPARVAVSCAVAWAIGVTGPAPGAASSATPADGHAPGVTAPSRTTSPPRPVPPHAPGIRVRLRPGAPQLPDEVSALSWLVADAGTGEVLAAHDAHRRLPPASTLKILFALTVLPTLPAGLRHTVTEGELADIGPGSSLVGVREHHTYEVADLWRGVFLSSGNDAVRVLAALGGGWRATAARMQARARALGAHDTRVVSPDGYDAPGQVSSAYDLTVFGRAGLRDKDFARYSATVEAEFPAGDRVYGIRNTNRLLTGDGVPRYPGLIGVKNGYTSAAGNTLVAAARRGDRTLIATVMNPQEGGSLAVYEEARALLDWGFRAAGRVGPVGSLSPPRPAAPAAPTSPRGPGPGAGGGAGSGGGAAGSGRTGAAALAGAVGITAATALGAGLVALALRVRRAHGHRRR
ncbi:D-alanyl-D-alanine carboxypeptidase [Streptomyces ruber]|uniref:D-alanyl-D-alanine carboxypeptidase n=2 Tax=Streptomyces TaxID=1883 RepID=A0A918EPE1_9ACTN|nr:serine hydrolase [Streptomyces ruber]GGQ49851.1 D-alanyl-D-alanine carboxypeptidase [Streptomyces ruber]